jgi:hypothetical protein
VRRVNQFGPEILNDFTVQQFRRIDCQVMGFVTVARRIFGPEVLRSLFRSRDFILTGKIGVNRPVAVVGFCGIAGAAAAKETTEERDQRYPYRVRPLRQRLLNVLEFPHLLIDALGIGNQTIYRDTTRS